MSQKSLLDVITIGRSSGDFYGAQIDGRLQDMAGLTTTQEEPSCE